MISAIELERYIAGTDIFSVVVDKLRHGKKPYPIILLEVDKGSEVDFHYTVLPFSLTICLWVEGGEEFLLDAEEIA